MIDNNSNIKGIEKTNGTVDDTVFQSVLLDCNNKHLVLPQMYSAKWRKCVRWNTANVFDDMMQI